MTAWTREPTVSSISSGNFFKKCIKMVENIWEIVLGSSSLLFIMLKCLTKRGVIAVLPPPGGPRAVKIKIFSILMNCWSLRLYQPLWSRNWRSSYIGGCAPNYYFFGMFRSSTKTIYFLPTGAPNTPLFILSNLESMESWVWLAEVWALKVIGMYWYASGIPYVRSWFALIVFPVPVGPETRTWKPLVSSNLVRNVARWLSAVGTVTSWYYCCNFI